MSDKLEKDKSIAKVYQFLSNHSDWKVKADANEDGVVNQTEFRGFMLKNVNSWNGENKYDANDIITKFWKSIDTNTKGTMTRGYSNSSHLDNNEIANMERSIKITQAINVLLTNVDGYKCPQDLNKVKGRWTTSMQASLANKMSSYTGSVENQEEIITYLKTIYKESVVKTNADCIKDLLMQTEFAQITSTYKDYKYMEDSTLKNIIDNYIGQLKGTESFQDIMDTIKCLMKDYFAVSGVPNQSGGNVGSSTAFDIIEYDKNGQVAKNEDGTPKVSKRAAQTTSEERLEKFGGADNYGMLNDLQKEVAKKAITDAIKNALKTNPTYKDIYTANEAEFKDLIDNYADAIVNSASASDFESLKTFNGATFITDKSSELEAIKSNITTLNANRTTFIKKVLKEFKKTDEYAAERKAVIKKVFGDTATSETAIESIINKLSQAELTAKDAEFDTEIGKVNKKLPASFLSKLPATMSGIEGGTSTEIQLDNYYLPSYNSGDLVFKATGWGLSVTTDGKVSVNTSTKGGGTAKIEVYDKAGNLLASKTVEVKVVSQLNMSATDAKFNGDSMSDILTTTNKNAVQLSGFAAWGTAQTRAKSSITRFVNSIKSALYGKNDIDNSKLEVAAKRTILYYNAIIDQIPDRYDSYSGCGMQEFTFNYLDENGNSHTETNSFSQKSASAERDAGRTADGAKTINQSSTGIRMNNSYNGTHTFEFYLNSAILLKKFQEFYNM